MAVSRQKWSVWLLYAAGLCPAAYAFYLGSTGQLGANPVKEFEHMLGLWALRFLILTLAVTPLRDLTGVNLLRYRRATGLLAFYYVVMHFSVYVILDAGMNVSSIYGDILRRPYITIGIAALVMLVPLALTSNSYSIRNLGKNWNRLHRLTYIIGAAGALHYYMAVKSITLVPFSHIAAIVLLLAYRPLKPFLKSKKNRPRSRAQASPPVR